MAQNVPSELQTAINRQVLDHVKGLSAHSDIAAALGAALEPLGDVQIFCPDSHQFLYVVASTRGIGQDTSGNPTVAVQTPPRPPEMGMAAIPARARGEPP